MAVQRYRYSTDWNSFHRDDARPELHRLESRLIPKCDLYRRQHRRGLLIRQSLEHPESHIGNRLRRPRRSSGDPVGAEAVLLKDFTPARKSRREPGSFLLNRHVRITCYGPTPDLRCWLARSRECLESKTAQKSTMAG